jgi:hypothetical protein
LATYVRARESTQNVLAGRIVRSVADRIEYLNPSADPFVTITKKVAKRTVDNPKFEWVEKGLAEKIDAVNGTVASGATAVVVDNINRWQVGDIGQNLDSGEKFLVTAVTVGSSTLTIVRSVGDTAAAELTDNDDLMIIGNAHPEGGPLPAERAWQETQPYNYTQIFRHSFGMTRTMSVTKTYGSQNKDALRAEHAIEHKIDIERDFHFGERDLFTSGSDSTNQPRRFTGGVLFFATSNIKASVGVLTEAEIEDWLEDVYAHTASNGPRLLLASPLVITTLGQLAAGRIQTASRDDVFGLALKTWVTGHGELNIVKDRLLENGTVSSQGYGGYAIALDPMKLKYVTLPNSDTVLRVDVGTPGDDAWTDEYLTECGLQFANPETAGVIKGVTG